MIKKFIKYFSPAEWLLWSVSMLAIIVSELIFKSGSALSLCASLIGITALIFIAKGNPFGQFLMIIFSIIYGIISYGFAYYGEMLTYLCMSGPMAVVSFITWIRNPFKGNHAEVKINRISGREWVFMCALSAVVTVIFYFVLDHFGTANIIPSTFSVTTSFIAVYLTFRRTEFFSLAYVANDLVLVMLWLLAALEDRSYIAVVICFATFAVNDFYGFVSWRSRRKKQSAE